MKLLSPVVAATLLFLFTAVPLLADRGRESDSWVFRSVLDERPRMVTLALNERLWAAFDAATCTLYKTWDGDVEFTGAVYDTVHGPQPRVRGVDWGDPFADGRWVVRHADGKREVPEVVYRGHQFDRAARNQLALRYELVLDSGLHLFMVEKPEVVTDAQGNIGMARDFMLRNMPRGMRLVLETEGVSQRARRHRIDTTADVEFGPGRFAKTAEGDIELQVSSTLEFRNSGPQQLKVWYAPDPERMPQPQLLPEESN